MLKDLKKITWTKPKDLVSNFVIVIAFSAFMTTLIYGLDLGVVYVQNAILNLLP